MFKKTRFNDRFEAGFIVKIFVALAAVLFVFQRMADWPAQASVNPNALANLGITASKLNFAQGSQPSGIVLSNTGTSTISWVFDTSGWYQTTGSTLHTGDDDYAQDWSRGVGQTAGHTVYAAISGVVARSYFSTTSYGNTIVIYDSQSGFAVRYAHLQDRFVAEGQQVVAGTTPIGTVGNSGSTQANSFSPHLHIVLYRNVAGITGRPVSFISLDSSPPSPYRAPFVFTTERVQACGNGTSEAFRNPTTGGAPVHPNGTLIKAANDGTVYLIQNGQRRWVSSPEVLRALHQNGGFDFKDVITVAADELSSYPIGANITGTLSGNGRSQPEGRLIRQQGQGEVSIVTNNGMRRAFPSSGIFLSLGYLFCNVVEVSDYYSYPAGSGVDGISLGSGGGGGGEITTLSNGQGISANVAQDEQKNYRINLPSSVTKLTVQITGSGDADLYVKYGSQATLSNYDCRPYLGSSNEQCIQNNPPAGDWFVMVNGYSSASYTLTATYQIGGNSSDAPCTNCTLFTSSLASSGASSQQPNGSYYYSSTPGTHNGWLRGPTGADFDLFLFKWNGSAWDQVAKSESSTPNEQISYSGISGYYAWVIYSYSGSGNYSFWLQRPQ